MNNSSALLRMPRPLLAMIFGVWLAQPPSEAQSMDETFKVLETRTGTYTNVTVTTKAKSYIFIAHASGMTNIKLQELSADTLQRLGYEVTPDKGRKKEIVALARGLPDMNQAFKPLGGTLQGRFNSFGPQVRMSSESAYTALAIALLVYLFFCYCCQLICVKANSPKSFLVWIPVLQIIPLLRAAKMSGWWFLPGLIPVLNILPQVLWSLNIAKARGKSVWVGIFLILPVTNLLAFLYLAFSSGVPVDDAPRYQSMALQTA